ncbi:hypothetical protein [Parvibaculum sp.]|uniref:porin n=1 Tax=Parvibaculum sp. TaxID=2024848 RepID=UPI000EE9DC4A|nr:hypothetical protein [Parvibaculum sp.]MBO6666476.1 hypothetical protein [Parvibaculum sp.]MBO6690929.1 hypothetical protein [Parvibaculum sp.]MBO6713097.1 hypothetical protein [Parvibaculum sp.]HAC57321.1 hypothetical protein [Rhodobiaceae bacterium]
MPLKLFTIAVAGAACCALAALPARAEEGGETCPAGDAFCEPASGVEPAEPEESGPDFHFGGAIRANVYHKSWEAGRKRRNLPENIRLDTVMLDASFESGRWDGSMQYRFYYYSDDGILTHFPHHAWIGYRPDARQKIQAGIQKVPFGLLPFASNNFFFSLAFYAGLEDDYDLGFRYTREMGPWTFDAAWFPSDEGSWAGDSEDSARYSYDIVSDGARQNGERHQFNLRAARSFVIGHGITGEAGASLQYGLIPNDTTGRDGERNAQALHARFDRGPWNFKTEVIRYEFDLENPPGQDGRYVTMGAFDYPYRVASRGWIYVAGLAYAWNTEEETGGLLKTVTFYNDYSYLDKAEESYAGSQQNVLGAGMDFDGPLYVTLDWALGRNNAYIGPEFTRAFASGGNGGDWSSRVNLNVALYF